MEESTDDRLVLDESGFRIQDPLSLQDLSETKAPTYSYSLDDGLHNFTIPMPLPTSSVIVSGKSFSVQPLVSLEASTSKSKSFTLVPKPSKKGSKVLLSKESRSFGPLTTSNRVKEETLELNCEWEECHETFDILEEFLNHVSEHENDIPIISTKIASGQSTSGFRELVDDNSSQKTFGCLWQDCGFETTSSGEMIRHLNFHAFHTKIKSHGQNVWSTTKIQTCTLSKDEQNVLPQLPECDFMCQWEGCERSNEVFAEPMKYYWHVQWHTEEYRVKNRGQKVTKLGKVECKWNNCTFKAGTISKLKEHVKSHSAERTVACPNCGGLFSSRSKFLDHCQRQKPQSEQSLKCSYCQKLYPTERILRDHMRSHINHFQCQVCDMTCPSATAMNKHIVYRHSDERAFPCPFKDEDDEEGCDYEAKTQNDLNKHVRNVHYQENILKCPREDCERMFKSSSALKCHIEKSHDHLGPRYCCHMCKKRFRRGNYLTNHLATAHDYKWPPGHKKFHYTMDEQGLYHVQTMRFESFELAENASTFEVPTDQ